MLEIGKMTVEIPGATTNETTVETTEDEMTGTDETTTETGIASARPFPLLETSTETGMIRPRIAGRLTVLQSTRLSRVGCGIGNIQVRIHDLVVCKTAMRSTC